MHATLATTFDDAVTKRATRLSLVDEKEGRVVVAAVDPDAMRSEAPDKRRSRGRK